MKYSITISAVSLILIGFLTGSTIYFYNKSRSMETSKSVVDGNITNLINSNVTPTPQIATTLTKPADPKGRLSYPAYTYDLQPLESLVAVGEKMDVPWVTIKNANNISNENSVQAGQKLVIPIKNYQTDLYRIDFIINEDKATQTNIDLRDVQESDQFDPIKVAKSSAVNYFGIQDTDEFKLVEADLNQGIAYVESKNADFTNTIGLIQPKVKGAKGFWAVKYIENKE